MKFYEVGGCVRDRRMGVKSKDIDYSVVMEPSDFPAKGTTAVVPTPYDVMVKSLQDMGMRIFYDNDGPVGAKFFTVRAQAPKDFPKYPGRALDFVLARKDGDYSNGRSPESVEVGTLMDDLRRRDFTMNAIAEDQDGNIIDPFDGVADIDEGVIRAVGSAQARLSEDSLRAIRAMRFAVTKGFRIDKELEFAMSSFGVLENISGTAVSDERIKDEVEKMFAHSTMETLAMFNRFPALTAAMFSGRVGITTTMKTKGRNVPQPSTAKYPAGRNGCTCGCHTHGGKHIAACC
jgi:tRNA nucleotidyltransferase/poly(A) polymerase